MIRRIILYFLCPLLCIFSQYVPDPDMIHLKIYLASVIHLLSSSHQCVLATECIDKTLIKNEIQIKVKIIIMYISL